MRTPRSKFHFIKRLLYGLIIGVACVTPGFSGGVLAAAVGLYEPMMRAITNLFKDFKNSVKYLLPLGIGGAVGILAFSKLMEQMVGNANFSVVYFFLGLVAGSLPALLKEANEGGYRKNVKYIWATLIAFALVILVESVMAANPNMAHMQMTPVNIMICGGILAIGTVIPGISSSFILMYLGMYDKFIGAVANFDFSTLALLAVGFVAVAALIIKLAETLFRKHRACAYYTVLGFLLGSMVMVFPGFRQGGGLIIDILLFIAATVGSYFLMKLNEKHNNS